MKRCELNSFVHVHYSILSNYCKQRSDFLQIISDNRQLDELKAILKSSDISDLTEFGRIVHAEMEAILACSREGISTYNTTLHCTTFPCHNCAKHIIASGIKRVVYVEPYPKSKALELHNDSIQLSIPDNDVKGTDVNNNGKVIFEPFIGVGPRRFLDLFSMNLGIGNKLVRKDKESGQPTKWAATDSNIRTPLLKKSYLDLEKEAMEIYDKIKKFL